MLATGKGVVGRTFLRMAQQVMRFSGKGIVVRAHRLARSAARCNSSKATINAIAAGLGTQQA